MLLYSVWNLDRDDFATFRNSLKSDEILINCLILFFIFVMNFVWMSYTISETIPSTSSILPFFINSFMDLILVRRAPQLISPSFFSSVAKPSPIFSIVTIDCITEVDRNVCFCAFVMEI